MLRVNLKSILDERQIPIRKLARDINYRFDSVRNLYNDELERLPKELIYKVCVYLQITPNDLLVLEKEQQKESR